MAKSHKARAIIQDRIGVQLETLKSLRVFLDEMTFFPSLVSFVYMYISSTITKNVQINYGFCFIKYLAFFYLKKNRK